MRPRRTTSSDRMSTARVPACLRMGDLTNDLPLNDCHLNYSTRPASSFVTKGIIILTLFK
jgi:hypothetical protein